MVGGASCCKGKEGKSKTAPWEKLRGRPGVNSVVLSPRCNQRCCAAVGGYGRGLRAWAMASGRATTKHGPHWLRSEPFLYC